MTTPESARDGKRVPTAEREDDACCALISGHDGCCVYVCSMCNGTGNLGCYPDDTGCACGFCDGQGYCQQCGGDGFFNENGEPCVAFPNELAAFGTCDWGGCDEPAERFRQDDDAGWLPVCANHREPEEATDG